MLRSPFTFLRGSAGLMAYDLATTASDRPSGAGVRRLPPDELWPVCHPRAQPRLRHQRLRRNPARTLGVGRQAPRRQLRRGRSRQWPHRRGGPRRAVECVRAYREHLRDDSKRSPLDVWYERLDVQTLIDQAPQRQGKKAARGDRGQGAPASRRISLSRRSAPAREGNTVWSISRRSSSIAPRRRGEGVSRGPGGLSRIDVRLRAVLFDRYRLQDFAVKVVGIGSVGTRCYVALFFSAEGHPSCCSSRRPPARCSHPMRARARSKIMGERIVVGQRLMQSSSDIFLGWTRSARGLDFFGRQLRDMKMVGSRSRDAPPCS